jgi:D-alanyl-D-alanine dipeptidase
MSKYSNRWIWILTLAGLLAWGAPIPSETAQLLVVVSPDWSSDHGRLYRLERREHGWRQVGRSVAVKLGRHGLGWGRGLHGYRLDDGPVKREGDGRAPAGVFALPFLFGEGADRFRYPYRRMSDRSRCVDDRRSRHYNRIVEEGKVSKDWRSAERMKFASGLYRYGIFVAHNPRNLPGAGSCIFLHIKKPSGKPTVGCTAMSQRELLTIMRWLDPRKHPLLVQAPKQAIGRLLPANLQLTQLR